MLPSKLAFVDIETTGASLSYDRIIEIGIVRVEENEITKTYKTLVNPQVYISPFIENLTGITKDILTTAPTFDLVQQDILDALSDCILVAHNVRFDYGFLRNEFRRFGTSFTTKHFCSVKLARLLYPTMKRHNLDSIIERFGITCENRHRAFDDALVLWEFYKKIQNEFSIEKVSDVISQVLKKPSIPINLPLEQLESLPQSPGVYIFSGEGGIPLYIGKSVNIRDRVLSHFSSDHLSSTEMKIAQQVRSIDIKPTCGELGALFKESTLIKECQPLYNKQLRLKHRLVVAKEGETEDGYKTIVLEDLSAEEIPILELPKIIGIFRSFKQAKSFFIKQVELHRLCDKLINLEKTKDACFGYRLGRCKGACVKKELAAIYNLRFLIAFNEYKMKAWPYKEAIIVEEQADDGIKREGFVFHNWCYLGTFYEDEGGKYERFTKDTTFDLDTYKILVRYLFSNKAKQKIKEVPLSALEKYTNEGFIPFSLS